MAHKYTTHYSEFIRRDGGSFAYVEPLPSDESGDVPRFVDAIPQVIEALRDALDAMQRMDARLLGDDPQRCEKGEITRARAALAAIGAL